MFLSCLRSVGFFLLLTLLAACKNDSTEDLPDPAPAAAPTEPPKPVPRFVADSAYTYVARQVNFGPRVMNTPAHEACKDWLIQKLEDFGAEVVTQQFTATAYDGTPLQSTNILGRYRPELPDRILLGAHWDTRHVADSELETDPNAVVNGADDGASGVGVLLELARQLGLSTPGIGVDIIFFDAEDYGSSGDQESWALGAQHYAKNMVPPKPRYGILLDMVGAKDARFAIERGSQHFAPHVIDKVWTLAGQMKFGNYFVREEGGSVLDDHYFVNTLANLPMIDIINHRKETKSGFVKHWHTGNDNLDIIDRETLRVVGQLVTAVVYREAAGTI
ncbi:MAG: M28 family peptidase [Bacteroidota bacterium]